MTAPTPRGRSSLPNATTCTGCYWQPPASDVRSARFSSTPRFPPPKRWDPESIQVFDRLGRSRWVRSIYITAQVAHATDLYRRTERHRVVKAAQRSLRARFDGSLLVVDDPIERRGKALRRHRIPGAFHWSGSPTRTGPKPSGSSMTAPSTHSRCSYPAADSHPDSNAGTNSSPTPTNESATPATETSRPATFTSHPSHDATFLRGSGCWPRS